MSNSNEITLNSYGLHVKEYLKATPQEVGEHEPEMKEWIDETLLNTPKSGIIFEIGSAIPRDAKYMRQQGYSVICSDAVDGFVNELKKEDDNVRFFNVLKDTFPSQYNTIFANGVFPHFNYEETSHALNNIHNHLVSSGILSFSIKVGTGEEWISEKFNEKRFTHYWSRQDILSILDKYGFKIIFENNNQGPLPSHHWLNLICQKV